MKLPRCILLCFKGRPAQDACGDSSNFSVGRCPGPSTTAGSGVLNSFMSRHSGSRGTWDISATEAKRSAGRAAGQDVVTLATARYLELFTAAARNEESAVFSDARGVHDSLRSVRTASEYCPSRGSRSSTVTGRASREASRLGACPNAGQQSFCVSVPGPLRSSVTQPRAPRRPRQQDLAPKMEPSTSKPGPQPGSEQHQAPVRKSSAVGGIPALVRKRHTISNASRSRSDRISPSAAAFLLPAPSILLIARAHTALPAVPVDATGLESGPSLTELQRAAATPAALSIALPEAKPIGKSPPPMLGRSSTLANGHIAALRNVGTSGGVTDSGCSGFGGGMSGPFARRSRMHAESVGGGPAGAGHQATSAGLPSVADSGYSASLTLTRPHGSATSAHGSVGGRGRRRCSIHFTPDGDVTVTGLPPTILSAGRVPRCLPAGRDSGIVSGSHASPGLSSVAGSAGARTASAARPSFDVYCSGPSCGPAGAPSLVPAIFLASRSVDGAACGGGAVSSSDIALTLNHTVGMTGRAGSASPMLRSGGLPVLATASQPRAQRSTDNPRRRSLSLQPQNGPPHGEHEHRKSLAFPGLAAANAAARDQPCNWGESSLYAPSAHSASLSAPRAGGTSCTGCHHLLDRHDGSRAAQTACARHGHDVLAFKPGGTVSSASNALPPPASGDLRGEHDSSRMPERPSDTCGSDAFAGFSGHLPEYRMLGSSLLATEAQDVTSALSRLQEACMTAVCSDMRSQRLAKRASTDFTAGRWPLLTQGTSGNSVGPMAVVGGGCSGGSSGLNCVDRLVSAVAAGADTATPKLAGPGAAPAHRRSASIPRGEPVGGAAACASTEPSVSIVLKALSRSSMTGAELRGSTEPADAERTSTLDAPIVMDGRVLEGMQLEDADEQDGGEPHGGYDGGTSSPTGDPEADAYRTRMLNVLLRGDFLHDTQSEDGGPGSDDDDEGVVEYRYGGFELGGDATGCGFERQASFVEAVRRCRAIRTPGAAGVEGPVGAAGVGQPARTSRFGAATPGAGDRSRLGR